MYGLQIKPPSMGHTNVLVQSLSVYLEKKYEDGLEELNKKLRKQAIGVQMGTDGWKRKNVNEAQKLRDFLALYPDGGSDFLGVENDM